MVPDARRPDAASNIDGSLLPIPVELPDALPWEKPTEPSQIRPTPLQTLMGIDWDPIQSSRRPDAIDIGRGSINLHETRPTPPRYRLILMEQPCSISADARRTDHAPPDAIRPTPSNIGWNCSGTHQFARRPTDGPPPKADA